jgi:hypothetical protein
MKNISLIPIEKLLEEVAENFYKEQTKEFEDNEGDPVFDISRYLVTGFIDGAKWMEEKMFSEEDMRDYSNYVSAHNQSNKWELPLLPKEWFKQFKK